MMKSLFGRPKIGVLSLVLPVLFAANARGHALETVDFCAAHGGSSPTELRNQTDAIRHFLRDKQVLYVSGYMGCSSGEFEDAASLIDDIDQQVPVDMVCPPSAVSIENNVQFLVDRMHDALSENPGRKIILVGHSKGGAEVLQTLVTRPELLDGPNAVVSQAVTLSAAIGGSPLADIVLREDPVVNAKWDRFKIEKKVVENFLTALLQKIFLRPDTDGFRSLTSAKSTERNTALLRLITPRQKVVLSHKLFNVTASRDPGADDLPIFSRSIGEFLMELGETNDGMVLTRSQSLPSIGTELMHINHVSHFAMIGPDDHGECRDRLMRRILFQLSQSPSL